MNVQVKVDGKILDCLLKKLIQIRFLIDRKQLSPQLNMSQSETA